MSIKQKMSNNGHDKYLRFQNFPRFCAQPTFSSGGYEYTFCLDFTSVSKLMGAEGREDRGREERLRKGKWRRRDGMGRKRGRLGRGV